MKMNEKPCWLSQNLSHSRSQLCGHVAPTNFLASGAELAICPFLWGHCHPWQDFKTLAKVFPVSSLIASSSDLRM